MKNDMLLIDCVGTASLILEESVNGTVKFRGKFQEANAVNKNKRMYPFDVLSSNVEKLEEAVSGRGLYGELDHPSDSIIHLANASHIITKLWWENHTLMGEGEILNTPSGKVLRSLIEQGGRMGISSRGVGNGQVNNEGVLVIGESYKLITFDAVADPSTREAYQSKVKRETQEHKSYYEEAPKAKAEPRVNPDSLISFFGAVLNKKVDEAKKRS